MASLAVVTWYRWVAELPLVVWVVGSAVGAPGLQALEESMWTSLP
jgi:hypothetical protein